MEKKPTLRIPAAEDQKGVLTHLVKDEVVNSESDGTEGRAETYLEEIDDADKLDPNASRLDAEEAEERTRTKSKN